MSAYTRSRTTKKRNCQESLKSSDDEDITTTSNRRKKVQKWLDSDTESSDKSVKIRKNTRRYAATSKFCAVVDDDTESTDESIEIRKNIRRYAATSKFRAVDDDTESTDESIEIRKNIRRYTATSKFRAIDDDTESTDESIEIRKNTRRYAATSKLCAVVDDDTESTDESIKIRKNICRYATTSKSRAVFESDSETESSDESVGITASSTRNGIRLAKKRAETSDVRKRSSRRIMDSDDDGSAIIGRRVAESSCDSDSIPLTDSEFSNEAFMESSGFIGSDLPTCPICFAHFLDQPVAVPSSCSHAFCKTCLLEWSKKDTTCPLDRMPFASLKVRHNYKDRKTTETIYPPAPVPPPDSEWEYGDLVSLLACQVCGSDDNEENLMLCDRCDRGFHIGCLDPPLSEVPEGEWFCGDCAFVSGSIDDSRNFGDSSL